MHQSFLNQLSTNEYFAVLHSSAPDNNRFEWFYIKDGSVIESATKQSTPANKSTVEFLKNNWVIDTQDRAVYVFSYFNDPNDSSENYVAHSFTAGKWQNDYLLKSTLGPARFTRTSTGNIAAITRDRVTSNTGSPTAKIYTLSH